MQTHVNATESSAVKKSGSSPSPNPTDARRNMELMSTTHKCIFSRLEKNSSICRLCDWTWMIADGNSMLDQCVQARLMTGHDPGKPLLETPTSRFVRTNESTARPGKAVRDFLHNPSPQLTLPRRHFIGGHIEDELFLPTNVGVWLVRT